MPVISLNDSQSGQGTHSHRPTDTHSSTEVMAVSWGYARASELRLRRGLLAPAGPDAIFACTVGTGPAAGALLDRFFTITSASAGGAATGAALGLRFPAGAFPAFTTGIASALRARGVFLPPRVAIIRCLACSDGIGAGFMPPAPAESKENGESVTDGWIGEICGKQGGRDDNAIGWDNSKGAHTSVPGFVAEAGAPARHT